MEPSFCCGIGGYAALRIPIIGPGNFVECVFNLVILGLLGSLSDYGLPRPLPSP